LVNLDLTDQELNIYAKQLSQTLDYIDNLNQIKTEKIKPTYQTTGIQNRYLEEKTAERTFSNKEALSNAPNTKNGLFQVPGLNYQK
jgi:aspartyl-tRNA(Asn)/glutamyl-tRNA(Gln) amidotransferase subunit C